MAAIEFQNVKKSYDGKRQIIRDFSLSVEEGEFISLLGPSGCGKTTLLKMVNKLIPMDGGDISIESKSIGEWDTIRLRRSIGYVIQNIGLFPHMDIEDNINYVPNLEKKDREKNRERAKKLIELVGLDESYLKRRPSQLSGGQRQRVGVARALAADSDIILMDEPFGAVDEIARTNLQDQLKRIHKRLKKTILFVTHDISEAIKLSDRIVLMNEGGIEQVGRKEDLIFSPKTEFVKEFMGIKGFKAILDEKMIRESYESILCGKMTVEEFYRNIV